MKRITVEEIVSLMSNSDNILIKDENEMLYAGYVAVMLHHWEDWGRVKGRTVKHIGLKTDISHKDWEKLGLMSPVEPKRLAEYSFTDLQMTVYRTIEI